MPREMPKQNNRSSIKYNSISLFITATSDGLTSKDILRDPSDLVVMDERRASIAPIDSMFKI